MQFEEMFKIKTTENEDHEFITIFRVIYDGEFHTNKNEVEDYKFVEIKDLLEDVENNPEKYTETFRLVIKKYKRDFIDN